MLYYLACFLLIAAILTDLGIVEGVQPPYTSAHLYAWGYGNYLFYYIFSKEKEEKDEVTTD